jgi:predicted RNA-binding Zn-ribbon protein involved in translation (DUF1610 family)
VIGTALQCESRTGTSHLKATLFCPRCGHESPADGDWSVQEVDGVAAYVCPECGREITRRPAH